VATKHTGESKSVSPAHSQSANPTNLTPLEVLFNAVQHDWHNQMELEKDAFTMVTSQAMDAPNRELWERYHEETRAMRRTLKATLDDIQSALWMERKLHGLPDDTLQAWAANAATTWLEAGGHHKAHRNEMLTMQYRAELKRRGLKPDGRNGSFNGDGAS
jgi:hypothetical protein